MKCREAIRWSNKNEDNGGEMAMLVLGPSPTVADECIVLGVVAETCCVILAPFFPQMASNTLLARRRVSNANSREK